MTSAQTTPTSVRELARVLLSGDTKPSCRELEDLHRRLTAEYSRLAAEAQRARSHVQEAIALGNDDQVAADRSTARAAEDARVEAGEQLKRLAARVDAARVGERDARLDQAEQRANDALARAELLRADLADLTARHVAALQEWRQLDATIREADRVLQAAGRPGRSGLEAELRPGGARSILDATVLPSIVPGGPCWSGALKVGNLREGDVVCREVERTTH